MTKEQADKYLNPDWRFRLITAQTRRGITVGSIAFELGLKLYSIKEVFSGRYKKCSINIILAVAGALDVQDREILKVGVTRKTLVESKLLKDNYVI